jgi:hypothetical protein
LEADAFERLVAAAGAFEVANLAELLEHGREGGGESVGRGDARDRACLGDELGRDRDPHPGQAADGGRVRVAVERGVELFVEGGDALPGPVGFRREFAHEVGGDALPVDGDGLGGCGGERVVDELLDVAARQPAGGGVWSIRRRRPARRISAGVT